MFKAIIFDVDGVLLDSYEANYVYIRDLGKLLGLKTPNKRLFLQDYYFRPTKEIFNRLNKIQNLLEFEEALMAARGKITSHLSLEKFFEDCNSTLNKLSKKYKLGVATSRSAPGLNRYLKLAKTKKYFKAIVGLEDVKNHKPHPEPLLLACKKLKVKPSQAVYIGDAPSDVIAAHAAGMLAIGYGKRKVKNEDLHVSHFNKLIPAIKKLETQYVQTP